MEVAEPAPPDWAPDVRLTLQQDSISEALATYSETAGPLRSTLDLGMVTLRPLVSFTALSLSPKAPSCSPCLRLQGATEGHVKVATALGTTKVPLSASFSLDVALTVEATPDGEYQLFAQPKELRRLTLKSGSVHADLSGGMGVVRDWLEATLVEEFPTIRLMDVDLSPYPVLAARLHTEAGLVALDIRSNVPGSEPLAQPPRSPEEAWALAMSRDVVLTMMRRAAFEAGPFEVTKGPLTYLLLAEPRGLELTPEGYELQLRLWSLKGRGWWRDYRATGPFVLQGKKVVASTDSIEAVEASPGAFFVDPVGAIVQSRVLDALSEGISAPFERRMEHQDAQVRSVARVTHIRAEGSDIHIEGTLKVDEHPQEISPAPGVRTRPDP